MITKEQIQSGEVVELKDFLTSDQASDCWDHANDCQYSYLQRSDSRSNQLHWMMVHHYNLVDFVRLDIWKAIVDTFDYTLNLTNAYINYADSGTVTLPHNDGTDKNLMTILICLNKKWSREWGGYTVWFESIDSKDIIKTICPEPRKAIFFKSSIYHYALPPIKFPGSYSRFMLALKCQFLDKKKVKE